MTPTKIQCDCGSTSDLWFTQLPDENGIYHDTYICDECMGEDITNGD